MSRKKKALSPLPNGFVRKWWFTPRYVNSKASHDQLSSIGLWGAWASACAFTFPVDPGRSTLNTISQSRSWSLHQTRRMLKVATCRGTHRGTSSTKTPHKRSIVPFLQLLRNSFPIKHTGKRPILYSLQWIESGNFVFQIQGLYVVRMIWLWIMTQLQRAGSWVKASLSAKDQMRRPKVQLGKHEGRASLFTLE